MITRFAPSPTGYLHKGHAFSALTAYRRARAENGTFLLRIEDIDQTRCRPAFTTAIYEDLKWLGLDWKEPVRIQSEHFDDYSNAIKALQQKGLIYPCFCTRKEIMHEVANAPSAPHGPEGPVYPGTCRNLSEHTVQQRMQNGEAYALRLKLDIASSLIDEPLGWLEQDQGHISAEPSLLGDIVLARKETPTSYHLSVVVDDGLQGITHIIRGKDLLHATHIHVVLQKLLGLPTPVYHHHALLLDEQGEKLAKSLGSVSIRDSRVSGIRASAYVKNLGFKS